MTFFLFEIENQNYILENKKYFFTYQKKSLHAPEDSVQFEVNALTHELILDLTTPPYQLNTLNPKGTVSRSHSFSLTAQSASGHLHTYPWLLSAKETLWELFMLAIHRYPPPTPLSDAVLKSYFSPFFTQTSVEHELIKNEIESIQRHMIGLGPIEILLKDSALTEIFVNGLAPIVVERQGSLETTSVHFETRHQLQHTCEKLALFMGHSFSPMHPICEGHWQHGERIEIIHPCIAPEGPLISIRRHQNNVRRLSFWQDSGSLSQEHYRQLKEAVRQRKTLVIAGTTGAGKTTLLQALTEEFAPRERWISIEDTPELFLNHPGHVRLLLKNANQDGVGGIDMQPLIRSALRLRPERFVIGEVRGSDALYLLQALSTGHSGSLATIHARSVEEARSRLLLMAGMHPQAPRGDVLEALIDQVVDGIVVVARTPDGKRQVTDVALAGGGTRSDGVLDLGHLERLPIVPGTQDFIRENNDDELTVRGHCHGGIEHVTV